MTQGQKHVAIYMRVSSKRQDTRSQEPDLKRWAGAQDAPVRWYRDKASGRTMDRPDWNRLEADLRNGLVCEVVVWRLDRLGRTARGLTALFAELAERKVNLRSLRDGLDLHTPTGRLVAGILASVSEYENEARRERILAGQEAARAEGKTWGGSKPGRRRHATREKVELVKRLLAEKTPIAEIARLVGVSRPTVYSIRDEPDAA